MQNFGSSDVTTFAILIVRTYYSRSPHEYSILKKSPALYGHYLPATDDWLHDRSQCVNPEIVDPPQFDDVTLDHQIKNPKMI